MISLILPRHIALKQRHIDDNDQAPGSALSSLMQRCAIGIIALFISGCAELISELVDDGDIGYCYSCEWIMQEWHDGWATHNSDPYDDEAACERELVQLFAEDSYQGYRCINEEELIDQRRDRTRNPSAYESIEVEHCWGCDWVVEESRNNVWVQRGTNTYKSQAACQQALWHELKQYPDRIYHCVY